MGLKEKNKRIIQNLYVFADSSKKRWLIFGVMFFVLFFIFIFKVNLSNKIDVFYGSDEWDYQTIAVNFATGHGFHVTGGFEKPEVYKFGHVDSGTFEKQELLRGITNIHRPPLYPLFVGVMYKIFGVNPSYIVIFQLLLLCIVAAGLPLLGFFLLQSKGFYSGIISGIVFMFVNHKMAEYFLPGQAFTAFFIFIFIFIAEKFFRKKTTLWAVAMAIALAVSLLFHATMILVVGFIVIYLLIDLKNGNKWINVKNLITFSIVFIAVLLPWHLFAYKTLRELKHDSFVVLSATLNTSLTAKEKVDLISHKAPKYGQYLEPKKIFNESEIRKITDSLIPDVKNKGVFFNNINASTIDFYKIGLLQEIIDAPDYFLVFLSITKNVAMDCHNEFITNGNSSPEWRFNSTSFYNNDNLNNKISFTRVYNFYKHNPDYILPLVIMKIKAALNYSVFLKLFFSLIIIYLFSKILKAKTLKKSLFFFFIVLGLVLINIYLPQNVLIILLLCCYFLFLLLSCILKIHHEIPISFNFVFFNLLIFTVIALGNYRYINVLDPFFILLCFFYLQKVTKTFYIPIT